MIVKNIPPYKGIFFDADLSEQVTTHNEMSQPAETCKAALKTAKTV